MNCDEIKLMISEYLDNELLKEKETFLFTHLFSCDGCREEFKVQNQIQNEVKKNQKEVSEKFEQRVFDSIANKKSESVPRNTARSVFISSSIAAIVIFLIAFSLFLFFQMSNYSKQLETATKQMSQQTELIRVLMHNVPAVQVTPQNAGQIIRIY